MKQELKVRRILNEEAGKWLQFGDNTLFRVLDVMDDDINYINVRYRFAGNLGDVLIYTDDEKYILLERNELMATNAFGFFKDIAMAFRDELGLDETIDEDALANYIRLKIEKFAE